VKLTVTRQYRFSASHRLHIRQFTEDENTRLYGKCNNPFGHGHNYVLEVTAEGPVESETGLAIHVPELDRLVEERVLGVFRDRNINLDLPQFQDVVPTTENIAGVIAELLRENWRRYISGAARLRRVHVQETDRNGFEVWVPSEATIEDGQSERVKVAV
jgi:6-pyruvoyltetrahydropterin/6-carboxytetrahydropterin synthase